MNKFDIKTNKLKELIVHMEQQIMELLMIERIGYYTLHKFLIKILKHLKKKKKEKLVNF